MTTKAACYGITRRSAVSLVLGLFASSSPSTVLRRVWATVITAINRVLSGGLPAHVSQEVLVGMQPAFTDANPPASIVHVRNVFGVIATLLHCSPRVVFGSSLLAIPTNSTAISMSGSLVSQGITPAVPAAVMLLAPPPRIVGSSSAVSAVLEYKATSLGFSHGSTSCVPIVTRKGYPLS